MTPPQFHVPMEVIYMDPIDPPTLDDLARHPNFRNPIPSRFRLPGPERFLRLPGLASGDERATREERAAVQARLAAYALSPPPTVGRGAGPGIGAGDERTIASAKPRQGAGDSVVPTDGTSPVDPITPLSEAQRRNALAELFAHNVREKMAEVGGLGTVNHSDRDAL